MIIEKVKEYKPRCVSGINEVQSQRWASIPVCHLHPRAGGRKGKGKGKGVRAQTRNISIEVSFLFLCFFPSLFSRVGYTW